MPWKKKIFNGARVGKDNKTTQSAAATKLDDSIYIE